MDKIMTKYLFQESSFLSSYITCDIKPFSSWVILFKLTPTQRCTATIPTPPQQQVGKNYSYLFNLGPNISNSGCLKTQKRHQ